MFAVVMEFLVWLADFLFSKRKSYVGTHWTDTVSKVEYDYHPTPQLCTYPNLWEARLRQAKKGSADCEISAYLRAPLRVFYSLLAIGREVDRIIWLSDYRWKDVPLTEWPESWRVTDGQKV